MTDKKRPSWKPRRRGAIYCAPACGANCTRAAYDLAVQRGEELRQKMKGVGWTVRVFENMGWFYEVVSGPIQVYPNRHGNTDRFWCMIGSKPKDNAGGCGLWTNNQPHYKDPNRAVREALKPMRKVIARFNETLRAAEKAAGIRG